MINIRLGTSEDIDAIFEVEKACFAQPWARVLFDADLTTNSNARYWVAEDDEKIIAFIGTHDIVGEINITNVATHPDYQNKGVGSMILESVIDYFEKEYKEDLFGITLEVRVSNAPAIALYSKYGFKEEGIRKHYYQDGEDASIMWRR